MMLDLESVRLFVLSVELGNFTRAAEAAGTVQPVVSQRLKGLEAMLGRKLLERTPRYVRPTADGAAFLERARALLAAHEEAVSLGRGPSVRIGLGASDHALGLGLEQVLRAMRRALPANVSINVRVGLSQSMRELFDAGEIDAALIRREGSGAEGEVLGLDPLGWRAAEDWAPPPDEPLPVAMLQAPCGVRAVALRALDRAGMPWREIFTGSSCAALLAAARAGLGVAPMGRLASGNMPDQGVALGLPSLPVSQIVLFARAPDPVVAGAVRILAAGVRASLQ
jgi:DNA-binding transcriptional LysR family regulator